TRFWHAFKGYGAAYALEDIGSAIVAPVLLCIACVLFTVFCSKAKEWWPVEVKCPACEIRLDKWAWAIVYCPGCGAHLYSPPQKPAPFFRRSPVSPTLSGQRFGETRDA